MNTGQTSVVTDSSRTVRTNTAGQRSQLLAAITIQMLDIEAKRTETNKEFNSQIKRLKKEARDLALGLRDALQGNLFEEAHRIATSAPTETTETSNGEEEEEEETEDTH